MRIAVALALSATLFLAACGDDSDSKSDAEEYAETAPEQIHEDVEDAMQDLESVRMTGTVFDDGQDLAVDVLANTEGECVGSMGMGEDGSFELLHVDGVSYIKPDEQFWTTQAGPAAAEQFMARAGDRWVTNSEDPNGFGELCDLERLFELLEGDAGDTEVVGTDEIGGVDVVKMTAGDDGFGYVAAEEPHRIIRIDTKDDVKIDFTDFDAELSAEKPAEDDVFDLASLG